MGYVLNLFSLGGIVNYSTDDKMVLAIAVVLGLVCALVGYLLLGWVAAIVGFGYVVVWNWRVRKLESKIQTQSLVGIFGLLAVIVLILFDVEHAYVLVFGTITGFGILMGDLD